MRVLVYDRTCLTTRGGLTSAWFAGSYLYRGLGRIDRAKGVASWSEALAWLAAQESPIEELQYWGHGQSGRVLVGEDPLAIDSLRAGGPHYPGLAVLRARLAPGALVWLRTCSAFAGAGGIAYAEALSDFLRARVAGHTYIIGFHQSGLHGLLPGARADWSADEGIDRGSRPWAPHTITCLRGDVPDAWFAGAS